MLICIRVVREGGRQGRSKVLRAPKKMPAFELLIGKMQEIFALKHSIIKLDTE